MFKGFSLRAKISLGISILIMLAYMNTQILIMARIIECSYELASFGLLCVLLFIPPFAIIFSEMASMQKLSVLNKKNLQNILDDSCLVLRADAEGRISFVNELFCRTSGYKPHELLGKPFNSLGCTKKHDEEFWDNAITTTVEYKAIWKEVVTYMHREQRCFIVNTWMSAEFDENGKHVGYLSVGQDITELMDSLDMVDKKSKEVENVISAIDKSNAVIEFFPYGNIITANQNFLDLMGYSLDEIEDQHHSIFVDEKIKLSKEYDNFWKSLRDGKFRSGEFVRYKKNGDTVYIQGTYNPIMDENGKLEKVLKVVTDITDSVIQKQEIERKNAYLEHAAKILRHDMHSGINTYIPRGLSSLKRRITDEKIKELRLESPMKMLEEGLKHAQQVYNGVKEFTNLVKKDAVLEKEFLNLKVILENYLSSTSYKSQVEIDDLPTFEVNEPLFCTAIDNLIRNGLKYNDSSTKKVHIYYEDDHLIIEDNGRGMTKEQFKLYSQPYTRAKNQKESGSGLGLNICISILKEHGFEIECIEIRQGTKLKVKL